MQYKVKPPNFSDNRRFSPFSRRRHAVTRLRIMYTPKTDSAAGDSPALMKPLTPKSNRAAGVRRCACSRAARAAYYITERRGKARHTGGDMDNAQPLLEIKDLYVTLGSGEKKTAAVNGVSLAVHSGKMLGLVGESGSGKTTVARAVMRLVNPQSGSIRLCGNELCGPLTREVRQTITSSAGIIFQDPTSSLNARAKVEYIVSEGLLGRADISKRRRSEMVAQALEDVGLLREFADRFPHEFSGGQRQRIGIARALITRPKLLIADEAVSALDVSVRAGILNLLCEQIKQLSLGCLFIAHDLSVVRYMADEIAVICAGYTVETGSTQQIFGSPMHPYTRALLSCVLSCRQTVPPRPRSFDRAAFVASAPLAKMAEIQKGHWVREY